MRFTTLLAATALLSTIAYSQDKGGKKKGGGPPPMINITVAAFPDGGHIPEKYTCAAGQGSPSPAISWTGGAGAPESYVLIMHDPDPVIANSVNDVLHWAIFDIPGGSKGLPEGVKPGDQADGAKQINNIAGMPAYLGPCPPPGHGDHHYTIEIYALNAKLGLPSSTSRMDLMNAMNGKVISKGVYIGFFGRK